MKRWFNQVVISYPRALTLLLIFSASFGHGQDPPTAVSSAPRRVKVAADAASALVIHKELIQYPQSARQTAIQGTVVLSIVVGEGGDVKEVTIASGDPTLAEAASDSVKQWKYKPYVVDGAPVEMETEVSVSFHLKIASHPTRHHWAPSEMELILTNISVAARFPLQLGPFTRLAWSGTCFSR
jgi:TonB family protein